MYQADAIFGVMENTADNSSGSCDVLALEVAGRAVHLLGAEAAVVVTKSPEKNYCKNDENLK